MPITPQPTRRHNPVDSICRKLQTIQWHGNREPYSPFQIPKISSTSYDSPECGLRHNLEAILKKGTPCRVPGDQGNMLYSTPSAEESNPPTPANITYSITSTLGDKRGIHRSDIKPYQIWPMYNSTPTGQPKDSPYFTFTQSEPRSPPSDFACKQKRSATLSQTFTPVHDAFSYNLDFSSGDAGNSPEFDLPYPALVVRRLPREDEGNTLVSESNNMAEVSLICEENLLDTIFHACDTQRRGKVYVSQIVDYLRHTTSRSPEDRGLEDLCNMLDPGRKDVSIDLETYHAVMREWIEDCRKNGEEPPEGVFQDPDKLRDSLSEARRTILLNMTSGSLEGFGGDVSRQEFETSELVYCLADLQKSNQKLQEEVKKLKQSVESMEESNQKLVDENEELRNQAKGHQQLVHKEKMLHDEVEEMKATLNCTEEGRARASARSKHVEKENQGLIVKIASLQEENFRVTMEMDKLQKRITELCDNNADLQVQIESFDTVVTEKEALIQERNRQIDELEAIVEEYTSVTELLRADKSKLENHMQMIHPDFSGAGVSLSVAYRLNQSTSGSLQTELALAQSPLEVDPFPTGICTASPLDETLDREVLLMMHGPSPEIMAQEFKKLLNKMKSDFRQHTNTVLTTLKALLTDHSKPEATTETSLKAALDATREDWDLTLDQLAHYTDSREKELIKMASNMRRSRTDILHLTVRVQDQENQKRQLSEELEQLKTPQDSREASCQTPVPEEEVSLKPQTGDDLKWDEEYALQDFLKKEMAASACQVQDAVKEEEDEKWMVVNGTSEGEARDTSTPVGSAEASLDGQCLTGESQESTQPEDNHQRLQDEAAVMSDAHSQAVKPEHPAADAPPDPSHSESREMTPKSEDTSQNVSISEQEPASPPTETNIAPDKITPPNESIQLSREPEGQGKERDMSTKTSLSQDPSAPRSTQDATSSLPVLVEEKESAQDRYTSMAGTEELTSTCADSLTNCQQSSVSSVQNGQSESNVTDTSREEKDSNELNRKELESPGQDSTLALKVDEAKAGSCALTEKQPESSTISEQDDGCSPLSPNEKEIETEFQRLALGFKCDMFTLEKRLRLEERSRDLAEENVHREVSSCQGLLQALTPLCNDDNQSMEIIHRLQKNLDILIQSMTRVSSRSEMLGSIHQESRIGKAVEVMIHHVENLRRVYTKEHAELLELREAMMRNERSFGSHLDRDEFRGKKPPTTQYYKSSTRRVSIAAIPRSGGGNMHYDMTKQLDGAESEAERLTRRSPWTMGGKNMARPPLKRFVSSAAWVETEEPSAVMKGVNEPQAVAESEESAPERRRSSLSELGSKLTSLILPLKTPCSSSSLACPDQGPSQSLSNSLTSTRATAAARGSQGLWLWLAMLLLLAGLLTLLASLVMQPAVDAAPVGTGDAWMAIQQILWPYMDLHHYEQPPV
ncbi:inositol 1,4,5-triphosphate receptor associated 2 isoform X2 [Stigmatopora argus]